MAKQETDLYAPVAAWFSSANFLVMAEVKSCDVIAVQGEKLTIIELHFSIFQQIIQSRKYIPLNLLKTI